MKLIGYNSVKSWGIAVACSFVNCMVLLPLRIAAMLFVEFPSRYNTDRQSATLFIIISGVLRCFAGPLIGYIGEIVNLKNLTVIGCLCASLGVGICYLAEDIITVTIFLGVLYGIGIGTITIMPQILTQHFTKNITNANGVINAGAVIGTFAIIPVISILLDNYGVSGALLLISGIMLHGLPMAMLLMDPKYKNVQIPNRETESNEDIKNQSVLIETSEKGKSTAYIKELACYKNISKIFKRDKYEISGNYKISTVCTAEEYQVNYAVPNTINCKNGLVGNDEHRIPNCQTISLGKKTSIKLKHDEPSSDACKHDLNSEHSKRFEEQNKYRKALETMTIFKDPLFLVIMLCQSAHEYITIFFYTIIIDISRDKEIPRSQERLFFMFIQLAQAVGYTCFGWVTDKGFLTAANYIAANFLCMGLLCCALVFATSFVTVTAATLTFAVCGSTCYVTCPSLMYDYIEKEKQSMAIASRFILFTPLSFSMVPLIGHFRGELGSYDGVLYFLAAFLFVCFVLLLFLPLMSRYINRKK